MSWFGFLVESFPVLFSEKWCVPFTSEIRGQSWEWRQTWTGCVPVQQVGIPALAFTAVDLQSSHLGYLWVVGEVCLSFWVWRSSWKGQNGNADVMFYSSFIAFVCFPAFFLLTCVPLVNHSFVFKPVFSLHSLLAHLWSPESVPLAPHVLSVVTVLHWFALCLYLFIYFFNLPASVSCIWVHFDWSACLMVKKYLSILWRLEVRFKAEFIVVSHWGRHNNLQTQLWHIIADPEQHWHSLGAVFPPDESKSNMNSSFSFVLFSTNKLREMSASHWLCLLFDAGQVA